jgi:hypothetical protein
LDYGIKEFVEWYREFYKKENDIWTKY